MSESRILSLPPRSKPIRSSKFADLELVRGIAALGVVVYHFIQAMIPPMHSPPVADAIGLTVSPPYVTAFINGPFMVAIFFVLSSYVLTRPLLRTPDARASLLALAKRLPRLWPLTLIGCLLPAVLFALGLMMNHQASFITGSDWMETAGGIKTGPQWPDPTIAGAFRDSLQLFHRGVSMFNSALWTMKYELFGSSAAIVTAFAIAGPAQWRRDILVASAIGFVALWIHVLCAACVATVFIVKYADHFRFSPANRTRLLMLVLGLALGSTYRSISEHWLLEELSGMRMHARRADWALHCLGAMLVFFAVNRWAGAHWRWNGIANILGRLSFPLYVLHVPLIGSIAAGTVVLLGYTPATVLLAFLLTMSTLFALSLAVARFDDWWVGRLRAWTQRFKTRFPAKIDTPPTISPATSGNRRVAGEISANPSGDIAAARASNHRGAA